MLIHFGLCLASLIPLRNIVIRTAIQMIFFSIAAVNEGNEGGSQNRSRLEREPAAAQTKFVGQNAIWKIGKNILEDIKLDTGASCSIISKGLVDKFELTWKKGTNRF